MTIEERIKELGLIPAAQFQSPTGSTYPFSWVRLRGNRGFISGHLPLRADGTLAEPRGKVGDMITIEQGSELARLAGLAMLGSLRRELGNLDRVSAWLRVLVMVNAAPGTPQLAGVANGFSEMILELYGRDRGAHSRSSVGVAELPFGCAVEIEAEIEIA